MRRQVGNLVLLNQKLAQWRKVYKETDFLEVRHEAETEGKKVAKQVKEVSEYLEACEDLIKTWVDAPAARFKQLSDFKTWKLYETR